MAELQYDTLIFDEVAEMVLITEGLDRLETVSEEFHVAFLELRSIEAEHKDCAHPKISRDLYDRNVTGAREIIKIIEALVWEYKNTKCRTIRKQLRKELLLMRVWKTVLKQYLSIMERYPILEE